MGVLYLPVLIIVLIALFGTIVVSVSAHWDGSRHAKYPDIYVYANRYWMPFAYVYDYAYNREESGEALAKKNNKRFGRD